MKTTRFLVALAGALVSCTHQRAPVEVRVFALPTPTEAGELGINGVPGSTSEWRGELCSRTQNTLIDDDWVEALSRSGFLVQRVKSGWIHAGPMHLRFRNQNVIGDLASTQDARGCRGYTIRTSVADADGHFPEWTSDFGDMPSFSRCIWFFDEISWFPITARHYQWGCEVDDDVESE